MVVIIKKIKIACFIILVCGLAYYQILKGDLNLI